MKLKYPLIEHCIRILRADIASTKENLYPFCFPAVMFQLKLLSWLPQEFDQSKPLR